ncbi:hypothetical protein [Akkermansia glycaniphila]|uniref:Uncharacterized protein n=1 Tax=Akkermansia glycaniphila TaxID=1679444 RepID=A0A1C7PB07_9BACT|nr:hypothetical protein [Akkermansia glycaniphila]OCA02735.1 hypothetical protein AC781_08690 [Akkermansia glycaniphila]SEH97288.1 Hypothetical protein PYTT_2202 [Akkermansia glycaniphila]
MIKSNNETKAISGISKIIGFIIVIGMFIGIVYAIYKFIFFTIETLPTLNAVVIVALITGALSIVGIVISKIFESRQVTKRYLYEKKEIPYTDIIQMIYKLPLYVNEKQVDDEEMINDMREMSKKISIWGSDAVIKKWHEFIKETHTNSNQSMFKLEEVILEIRKDLGQRNKKLERGDMLRFFVNDLDAHMEKESNC